MADTSSVQRGIKRSWGLLAFVKEHGQPRYVPDFQGNDGQKFAALSFSAESFASEDIRDFQDANGQTRKSSFVMVGFSQNCPATTIEEIVAQKNNLQVVELQRDSEHPYTSYKLCAKGEFAERGTLLAL